MTYALDAEGVPQLGAATSLPQAQRVLPPPAGGPLGLAPGSFVEILWPGIYPGDAPSGVSTDLAPWLVGWHLFVLDSHMIDGAEWYSVDWEEGWWQTTPKWVPAIRDGRPTIAAVEPSCPTGEIDLEALMWLTAAERLACFGSRELTLAPVLAAETFAGGGHCFDASFLETTCPDVGNVSWLEADPAIMLFGDRGPSGRVPGLAMWNDPERVGAIPIGQLLRVTGHFDDSLALDCQNDGTGAAYTGGGPALQRLVLHCRQRFVVTAFEAVGAP